MERIFDCHLNEMTPDNYNGKTAPLAASVFSCGAGMTNRQFGKRRGGGSHGAGACQHSLQTALIQIVIKLSIPAGQARRVGAR